MKVYWCTIKDMGEEIVLYPRIPETRDKEEPETPRICVSNSVLGCLSGIGHQLSGGEIVNIYSTDIDTDLIYQPTKEEVADVAYTGELWLTTPTIFNKEQSVKIGKEYKMLTMIEKEIDSEINLYLNEFEII